MNRKYRVAVIGTGLIGATSHIPAYQALSDRCEIIAVCDNRKEAAEFVAKRNGIEKVYTDSALMLEECIYHMENTGEKWTNIYLTI